MDMQLPNALVAAEIERRDARLADIELGLASIDHEQWRKTARSRIRALCEDRMDYGLMPHEQAELERLEQLVGDGLTAANLATFGVAFAICVTLMVGLSFIG